MRGPAKLAGPLAVSSESEHFATAALISRNFHRSKNRMKSPWWIGLGLLSLVAFCTVAVAADEDCEKKDKDAVSLVADDDCEKDGDCEKKDLLADDCCEKDGDCEKEDELLADEECEKDGDCEKEALLADDDCEKDGDCDKDEELLADEECEKDDDCEKELVADKCKKGDKEGSLVA
jgi:hypothetical protein